MPVFFWVQHLWHPLNQVLRSADEVIRHQGPLQSEVTATAAGVAKKPGSAFGKVRSVAPLKTEILLVLSTPVSELGLGSRRRHW